MGRKKVPDSHSNNSRNAAETPAERALRKELIRKRKQEKRMRKEARRIRRDQMSSELLQTRKISNVHSRLIEKGAEFVAADRELEKLNPTVPATNVMKANNPTTHLIHSNDNATSQSRNPTRQCRYVTTETAIRIDDLQDVVSKVRVSNVDLAFDTRILSKKMKPGKDDDVEELMKTYNSGPFSEREKEIVDRTFRQILNDLQVPLQDAAIIITPKSSRLTPEQRNQYKAKEYRKVMNTVCERAGVNRTVSQIYFFLRHKYDQLRNGTTERTKWTKEEDNQLKTLIERFGEGNWVKIEKILCKAGAKDRYDCLKSQKLGKWTNADEERLIRFGKEIMEREGISDPAKLTQWTELAQKMENRTYRECARHWILLGPKLSSRRAKWGYNDFKSLLLKMQDAFKYANDESETIWASIVDNSNDYSCHDVRQKWKYLKRKLSQKFDLDDYTFKDAIQLGFDNLAELLGDELVE